MVRRRDDCTAGQAVEAGEFFDALGPGWLLTADQQTRLAPAVSEAVAAGWEPGELAAFVCANSAGIRGPRGQAVVR